MIYESPRRLKGESGCYYSPLLQYIELILFSIITRNLQRPLLAVYSIRVIRFPPILIVFLTGIVIYITRAPCIGGGRAGVGRVAAKKN